MIEEAENLFNTMIVGNEKQIDLLKRGHVLKAMISCLAKHSGDGLLKADTMVDEYLSMVDDIGEKLRILTVVLESCPTHNNIRIFDKTHIRI